LEKKKDDVAREADKKRKLVKIKKETKTQKKEKKLI
jgi:hypothetical protein